MTDFVSHAYMSAISDVTHEMLDDNDVEVFLRLFLLLYADDTIILAESEQKLKAAPWAVQHYCKICRLEVNTQKTKVVIFSKGKICRISDFTFNDIRLEVVLSFSYPGVVFNYDGPFQFV